VAVLIAAAVSGADPDQHWSEVATDPGRLFFVGDPKQSIYRFRRADIGLFLEARDAFGGGSTVPLRQSFRTVPPVLDWVNHVFGELMRDEVPGAQAAYVPLAAHRAPSGADHRVVLLGGPRDLNARSLREQEAAAVAEAIDAIRRDPAAWLVQDQLTTRWREPRMADVTILVPTRTSLRQLEDALEAASIPFRVAAGSLVYDTQEVREVLDALRAVDDPGDAIALVAALRSPLYACSDVDLLTFRQAGGRWDLRRTPPPALGEDHPVARAVAHLRSLWEVRWWHEPSALLERLLRERQVHALAFSHRRPREVWRRLRFLVDQARAFEEAGGGGLRPFLAWAEVQRLEGSRVHEPMQAEQDDDAVSIQTIHGSKGLEFPITILSGASTQIGARRTGVQVLWDGDTPELKLRKDTATDHHARLADLEAEMDGHERARLLYVACTRARDHLIVSTFHDPRRSSYGEWLSRLSEDAVGTTCRRLDLPDLEAAARRPPTSRAPGRPPERRARARPGRRRAQMRRRRRPRASRHRPSHPSRRHRSTNGPPGWPSGPACSRPRGSRGSCPPRPSPPPPHRRRRRATTMTVTPAPPSPSDAGGGRAAPSGGRCTPCSSCTTATRGGSTTSPPSRRTWRRCPTLPAPSPPWSGPPCGHRRWKQPAWRPAAGASSTWPPPSATMPSRATSTSSTRRPTGSRSSTTRPTP
jgi:ATP-dependent exoDNAse (exonuclease V) beta subunit